MQAIFASTFDVLMNKFVAIGRIRKKSEELMKKRVRFTKTYIYPNNSVLERWEQRDFVKTSAIHRGVSAEPIAIDESSFGFVNGDSG
ncbi:MAG: hypothetical protein AAFW70_00300 [Cyanobacteria bacterium J06635_10]